MWLTLFTSRINQLVKGHGGRLTVLPGILGGEMTDPEYEYRGLIAEYWDLPGESQRSGTNANAP